MATAFEARRQLGTHCAEQLALRAVARQLGSGCSATAGLRAHSSLRSTTTRATEQMADFVGLAEPPSTQPAVIWNLSDLDDQLVTDELTTKLARMAWATHHPDGFVHPALFYRGVDEYLRGTVPFIRDGLAAGEPVAVAVPGPNLRLIVAELGTDAEQVRLLDMTQVGRNPGRIIPGVLRAFADAHPGERVRIIGEPIWVGRTGTEYPACAQHEALINLAFTGQPVTILCPYDADTLDTQILIDAEATHPLLIDSSGERDSTAYAPVSIVANYNQPLPPGVGPTFTFDATNHADARQFASDHAASAGLANDHAELTLIVGELIANSLVHGGGTGTLRIWAEQDYVVCEVRDSGHITDPLAGRRPADPHRTGGRGLLLVNYLSDLVRLHTSPQGTTLRAYLKVQKEPSSGTRGGQPHPVPAPLPVQIHDAYSAAARFARYSPLDAFGATETTQRPGERSGVGLVVDALTAVDTLSRVVDRWRSRLVQLARIRGAPWTDIGHSLGVSKQAAYERYRGTSRRGTHRKSP